MPRYRKYIEFDADDLEDAKRVGETLTKVADSALDADRRATEGPLEKRHTSWYEATS